MLYLFLSVCWTELCLCATPVSVCVGDRAMFMSYTGICFCLCNRGRAMFMCYTCFCLCVGQSYVCVLHLFLSVWGTELCL